MVETTRFGVKQVRPEEVLFQIWNTTSSQEVLD